MMKRRTEHAALADEMIGAAQILERIARELKGDATTIRRHGLLTDVGTMRMHKRYDVDHACRAEIAELSQPDTRVR